MFSKRFFIAFLTALLFACPALAAEEVNLDAAPPTAEISQDAAASPESAVSPDAAHTVSTDQPQPSADARSADAATVQQLLPEMYSRAIDLASDKEALTARVSALFAEGKKRDAARMIGAELGRERSGSLAFLGSYCAAVLPKTGTIDEQAEFLAQLLYGYGKAGVLLVTLDGISGARVYDRKTGDQWKKVPAGGVPTDEKTERVFGARGYIAVPFTVGEIFKVDLTGKEGGFTKVCKVMHGGVNSKGWQGGKWDRELTIRGDKLF